MFDLLTIQKQVLPDRQIIDKRKGLVDRLDAECICFYRFCTQMSSQEKGVKMRVFAYAWLPYFFPRIRFSSLPYSFGNIWVLMPLPWRTMSSALGKSCKGNAAVSIAGVLITPPLRRSRAA